MNLSHEHGAMSYIQRQHLVPLARRYRISSSRAVVVLLRYLEASIWWQCLCGPSGAGQYSKW